MSKSLVTEKAIKFALRIVTLYRYLSEEKKEYVLSKQILISGTYIAKHARERYKLILGRDSDMICISL